MLFYYDALLAANEDIKNDLVQAILEDKDVVMEHTLLRAIRREPYIKAIREVTDRDIDIYVVCPSLEQYEKNLKERDVRPCEVIEMLKVFEMPTKDEGYTHVYIVDENGIKLSE